jgi:23S rRNA pseudouridine1911/1915/1917 synthase
MSEPRLVKADRGDAGRRLDLVLQRHLKDVALASRTRIQGWIADGLVAVNGALVRRASARTAQGDLVSVALPDVPAGAIVASRESRLDIVYEDDHLIVVDKPAGLVVHPTYRHTDGTLLNALVWYARGWPAGQRPSLVGRLDKLTSGVLLVAKTRPVHAGLQRVLTSSGSEKDYLALAYGRVRPARGRIDLGLARDPADRSRVVASAEAGVPSVTEFERLGRVAAPRVGLALLRCRLRTGRMHQIRVHLAARGWPLVGDPKYGEPLWARVTDPALSAALKGFPRQALHAWKLALIHPVTRTLLRVEARVPPDLATLIQTAGLDLPTG